MMSSPSQVIVLAEDKRHQNFARHFLKRLGYGNHHLWYSPLPAGHGSGEQYVRERYAKEVLNQRARGNKAGTALLVVIDADSHSVAQRQQQLASELTRKKIDPRGATEAIAHLVPKWSIETWVLCLRDGQLIPEDRDCKFAVSDGDVKPSAEVFHNFVRSADGPPAHLVLSLCAGLIEARRIPAR